MKTAFTLAILAASALAARQTPPTGESTPFDAELEKAPSTQPLTNPPTQEVKTVETQTQESTTDIDDDLKDIFQGDNSMTEVEDIEIKPAEIDYTITQTTNIKGNKAEKIDFVDIEWEGYSDYDAQVSELFAMVGNDENVKLLADKFRDKMREHWNNEVKDKLPKVCDTTCRTEIRDRLKRNLVTQWKTGLKDIRELIKGVEKKTREHLENAYDKAFMCDHGCECQFVDNQYASLLEQIANLEGQIVGWNNDIATIQAKIDSVPYQCDTEFAPIKDEYEQKWADLKQKSDAEIAAMKNWEEDTYEMEDAVDQELFRREYGFDYKSSRFDRKYDEDKYARLENEAEV